MCGIAGIISKKEIDGTEKKSLGQMLTAMEHRGPNGEGRFVKGSLALGMRRLSVIDLEHGWQPIFNDDHSMGVLCNGEIYNYIELRKDLENIGHKFKTSSDIEVLLRQYEEYGLDFLQNLRGMYVFILFDFKKNRALLVRDRIGEKPVYLFENDKHLIFASEMKGLLASGKVPFELDPEAVNLYFHYQYVPEPRTPLKGIRKLPGGCYLDINLKTFETKQVQYWSVLNAPVLSGDPVKAIQDELDQIAKIIIRSDVPVGVALSGGIDSGAIAALASRHYKGSLTAFGVGYPGRPHNDERADAKKLADQLGIDFCEVELKTQDSIDTFQKMNFFRDDPIADISGFGYYAINRAAREKNIPVLIQGQGSDELFWGYEWVKVAAEESTHKQNLFQNPLKSFKEKFRSMGAKCAFENTKKYLSGGARRPIFHEMAPDFKIALRDMPSIYGRAMQKSGDSAFGVFDLKRRWINPGVEISKLICDTYLLENGIAQGDRLSMASSVELRLPFVDYRLMEIVFGFRKNPEFSEDFKQFPKPWLKQALRGTLPNEVLDRPKKGFSPPVREWHRGIFAKYGQALVDGELVKAEILRPVAAVELSTGTFPSGALIPISFKALVLEDWIRQMKNLRENSVKNLNNAMRD